jgi:hypothetical protein
MIYDVLFLAIIKLGWTSAIWVYANCGSKKSSDGTTKPILSSNRTVVGFEAI